MAKNTTGSWSNIVGAHEQNYITELLTQTTQFRRIVMSNGTSDHTSGAVVVTIVNSLPITNNSISGNQTINEGNTASFITGTSPSGGSGPESYRYIWQKNQEIVHGPSYLMLQVKTIHLGLHLLLHTIEEL